MACCVRLALVLCGWAVFGTASLHGAETSTGAGSPDAFPGTSPVSAPPVSGAQLPGSRALGAGSGIQWLGYLLTILVFGGAAVTMMVRGGFFSAIRPGSKAVRKLQIEETRMVGTRQYLVVAEYEGRRMLLGISPARIDYLSTLEGDSPTVGDFSAVLSGEGSGSSPTVRLEREKGGNV